VRIIGTLIILLCLLFSSTPNAAQATHTTLPDCSISFTQITEAGGPSIYGGATVSCPRKITMRARLYIDRFKRTADGWRWVGVSYSNYKQVTDSSLWISDQESCIKLNGSHAYRLRLQVYDVFSTARKKGLSKSYSFSLGC
jgi:hypothetical protein